MTSWRTGLDRGHFELGLACGPNLRLHGDVGEARECDTYREQMLWAAHI
jgi:hypothetical protein